MIPDSAFYLCLAFLLVTFSYVLYNGTFGEEDAGDAEESVFDLRERKESDSNWVEKNDRDGNTYLYHQDGYTSRFFGFSVGGVFQGLTGFGIGEVGLVSLLRTNIPARMAVGTNHVVVALTAVAASITHIFIAPSLIQGIHAVEISQTPWNIVFVAAPGTLIGGQIAPYVTSMISAETLKSGISVLFAVLSVSLFALAIVIT